MEEAVSPFRRGNVSCFLDLVLAHVIIAERGRGHYQAVPVHGRRTPSRSSMPCSVGRSTRARGDSVESTGSRGVEDAASRGPAFYVRSVSPSLPAVLTALGIAYLMMWLLPSKASISPVSDRLSSRRPCRG